MEVAWTKRKCNNSDTKSRNESDIFIIKPAGYMEIEWTVWKCDNNGIKNQDIFIIKPAGYIEIAQKQ